jgi:DNA/RNA-binding domain of Phe-tRNA-synthetase-like protein
MFFRDFSITPAYRESYPEVGFGLTLISGCTNPENPPEFDQHKRKLLRKLKRRETLAEVAARIDIYDRFFQRFGFECPLPKHLKYTVNTGFPRYNLMVDAHFVAEMCAGILVAVTDFDRFDGNLILDLAKEGEICLGMGGREFRTKAGEIVLRDERDIVCILCQGADEKTRVKESTRNVLFYAYAVPGIDAAFLRQGLALAAESVSVFGGGAAEGPEIFGV